MAVPVFHTRSPLQCQLQQQLWNRQGSGRKSLRCTHALCSSRADRFHGGQPLRPQDQDMLGGATALQAIRSSAPGWSPTFCRHPGRWGGGRAGTCPEQPTPAPMPMVGMDSSAVTAAATAAGTHSSTTAKHPAASSACPRPGPRLLGPRVSTAATPSCSPSLPLLPEQACKRGRAPPGLRAGGRQECCPARGAPHSVQHPERRSRSDSCGKL